MLSCLSHTPEILHLQSLLAIRHTCLSRWKAIKWRTLWETTPPKHIKIFRIKYLQRFVKLRPQRVLSHLLFRFPRWCYPVPSVVPFNLHKWCVFGQFTCINIFSNSLNKKRDPVTRPAKEMFVGILWHVTWCKSNFNYEIEIIFGRPQQYLNGAIMSVTWVLVLALVWNCFWESV